MDYPPLIDADPNDTETPFFVKTVDSMMRLLQVDEVTATTILARGRGEIGGDAIDSGESDDSDLVTDEG